MFIAMNRFKVIHGAQAEFEQVWKSRDTRLREVPGFPPSTCYADPSATTTRSIHRIRPGGAGPTSKRGRARKRFASPTAMPAPTGRFILAIPNSRGSRRSRLSSSRCQLFRKGERVAVHLRGAGRGRHTTIAEHMPSSHRRYAEWTLERIGREAAAIGPSTAKLAELILESRPHPEQGYRACLGILRLARQYGADRLEAACDRGLDIGARSYGSIQSILKHGLDKRPARAARQGELLPDHPNIRGSRYYH